MQDVLEEEKRALGNIPAAGRWLPAVVHEDMLYPILGAYGAGLDCVILGVPGKTETMTLPEFCAAVGIDTATCMTLTVRMATGEEVSRAQILRCVGWSLPACG